jgi:imidazolonepropionase-like amidohydrolase
MRVEIAAFSIFLASSIACVDSEPSRSVTPPINEDVTAFLNVNVVPMTSSQVLNEYTVLVEDGRITGFGPSYQVRVPTGATRIDGRGKFLMPGLTDMHGHLPDESTPAQVMENILFLYVANGVTTVRGMQGHESQFKIRERIRDEGFRDDKLLGPLLVLGSPELSGETVTSVEQAEALVRRYDDEGFDLLKIHEGLSPELYDTIARTARQLGMLFGGHVPDQVGLLRALEVRQTTIDHLDNYVEALVPEDQKPEQPPGVFGAHELLDRVDESRLPLLVRETRESGVSVVPTMVLWESGIYPTRSSAELVRERSEIAYMPRSVVDSWREAVDERLAEVDPESMKALALLRRRILRALHEGGANILLGTDSPQVFNVPGFSIHRELELYTEVGMTPFEALSTGTRAAGEYLKGDFGTIAFGQRADMIFLEANPLADVANLSKRIGVMVHGEFITEEEIQKRLSSIAAHYRR